MSDETTPNERWNSACLLRAQEDHFNQNRVRWLIAVAYFAFLAAATQADLLSKGNISGYAFVILAIVSFIFSWTMFLENWHYNTYLIYKLHCESNFAEKVKSKDDFMAMCEVDFKNVSPFHLTYTPINFIVYFLGIIFGCIAIRAFVATDQGAYLYWSVFVAFAIVVALGAWMFAARAEPTLGAMTDKASKLKRRLTPEQSAQQAAVWREPARRLTPLRSLFRARQGPHERASL